MKAVLLLLSLVACAQFGNSRTGDLQPTYEMATVGSDADAPLPPDDDVPRVPCAEHNDAASEGAVCMLADVSPDEEIAFKAETTRLLNHSNPACQKLGTTMEKHLADVRMYDSAIVRYVGPYKLYGVGHSYQAGGGWVIRIARRLDGLNVRPMAVKVRTLRHEMSHTLGAEERRVGARWSAWDYAERCG